MVMRDTRVGKGDGVNVGITKVGDGCGVGVGRLREQAAKARGTINNQINRFMSFPRGPITR
jgi:hypothetical protein